MIIGSIVRYIQAVVMPARAFIDSDQQPHANDPRMGPLVVMPARAFIDSDVVPKDYNGLAVGRRRNAREGIY